MGASVVYILRLNTAGQPVEWLTWQETVCLYSRELTRDHILPKSRGGVISAGEKAFTTTGNDAWKLDDRSIFEPSVVATMDSVNYVTQTPANQLS